MTEIKEKKDSGGISIYELQEVERILKMHLEAAKHLKK